VWFVGFGGAPAADLKRLSGYAQNIGLAFQIVDDILDITATQEELGKTAGKDLQALIPVCGAGRIPASSPTAD